MDDYGTSHNILNGKALVVKGGPGIALIAEERYQISGMVGMGSGGGIIVISRAGEAMGAVSCIVDMHGVEIAGAGRGYVGEAEYLRFHQNAAVGSIVKFDQAA